MNSLLYYYNNVQKMAAYRQAKRMQRGVKLGYLENSLSTSSKRFLTPPINIGLSDYSIEYFGNTIGSNIRATYMRNSFIGEKDAILSWGYTDINGIDYIRFGNSTDGTVNQVHVNFKSDNDAPFHLVITRQGLQIKIYVNDSLYGQLTTNEVFDMKNIELIFINSSNIGFVRVWNYALSADEIATLDNNGDPMGYVVPKAMRNSLLAEYLPQNLMASRKGPEVEPTADTFEFGIDSPYYRNILPIIEYPYQCSYHVEYIVDELDIQSVNGSIGGIIGFGAQLNTRLSGDTYFGNFQSSDIGVVKTFTTTFLGNNLYGYVSLYAGNPATTEFRVRKLKVRIISIKPLTNITGSWLDSAKQLPLSDEYMEPLFQSIGGYDMAANGVPEIIYNE